MVNLFQHPFNLFNRSAHSTGPRKEEGRHLKMRPRWLPDGPSCVQDVPRQPQEHSQEGPEQPISLNTFGLLKVFGFLNFSSSRRSKTAQEALKTVPSWSKRLPREPQDGPRGPKDGPIGAQGSPRGSKHCPKTRPRRSKRASRRLRPHQDAQDVPRDA